MTPLAKKVFELFGKSEGAAETERKPAEVQTVSSPTPSRANSAKGRRPSTGPEKRSAPRAAQRLGGVVARRGRPPARSLRGRPRL